MTLYEMIFGVSILVSFMVFLWLMVKNKPSGGTTKIIYRDAPSRKFYSSQEVSKSKPMTRWEKKTTTWNWGPPPPTPTPPTPQKASDPDQEYDWSYLQKEWDKIMKHCPSVEEIENMSSEESLQVFKECIRKYEEENGLKTSTNDDNTEEDEREDPRE